MKITLNRKSHFNAAHQLYVKEWEETKNKKIFGKCSNPNFHGHNYELIVSVTGEIDPKTGFVISVETLKEYIKTEVIDYLDHKNLNIEVVEFKTLNPTVENISVVIWNRLRKKIPADLTLSITLYETPRNFAIYNGN